jgi:hypothetical protein
MHISIESLYNIANCLRYIHFNQLRKLLNVERRDLVEF